MIVIKVFGLDPYLLRDISEDLTSKLASLYEISEDEIDFYGSEGLIVHKGVEQNTWNIFIEVVAPKKVSVLEEDAFTLLEHYFKNVSINIKCVFSYYSMDNYHLTLNEDYPRFMNEEENNEDGHYEYEYDEEYDYEEEGEDGEETHHHEHHHYHNLDLENENDIFLGNAFEDFEDKLKGKK